MENRKVNKKKEQLNKATFFPPAILITLIIIIGIAAPKQLGTAMSYALNWCTTNFGWFYVLGTTVLIVFCLWVCLSKYGKIKLGGKDAKPETSFFKWFCIVLTSGMGAGLCYWCVAEPMSTFLNPPAFSGLTGGTAEAAEMTLRYSYMHWTLHPYAIYTAVGVALGFMYWNAKRPFTVASGLYPMLGEKANGKFQNWINAICIFALVAGLGTTFGLAVDQISTSLNYLTGKSYSMVLLAAVICIGFALIAIITACAGLQKGAAKMSSLAMYIFIALMVFALFTGGTLFIVNNTVTSIGQYFQFLFGQSFYLEPAQQTGWVNAWTVFYLAWWLAFAPLVGLFQIKMSKGRTIRQYIIVNMFVPCLFLIVWFGIFGSSSINMTLQGNTAISDAINELGTSVAFFAYLKQLPLSGIVVIIAMAAVILSIVMYSQSQIMTISDLCIVDKGGNSESDKHSPVPLKIFWGAVMGLMAFVLLFSGGLDAVKTASIILGLPMLALILLMVVSCIKGLKNYKEYDKTLAPGDDYTEE